MPSNPRFEDLPSPFLSELSHLLAARNLKRTLSNLNVTNQRIRADTLAGLWEYCELSEDYPLEVILQDEGKAIAPLIRGLWIHFANPPRTRSYPSPTDLFSRLNIHISASLNPSPSPSTQTEFACAFTEFDTAAVRALFPNLRSLILDQTLTREPDVPLRSNVSVNVPFYHRSAPFQLRSHIEKGEGLMILMGNGVIEELESAQKDLPPPPPSSDTDYFPVTMHVTSGSDCVGIHHHFGLVAKIAPRASSVNLDVRISPSNWYSQAEWLSSLPLLSTLRALHEITYTARFIDPSTPPFDYASGPSPNHSFMEWLVGKLVQRIAGFRQIMMGVEGEGIPTQMINGTTLRVIATRYQVVMGPGGARRVSCESLLGATPSGPEIPWKGQDETEDE